MEAPVFTTLLNAPAVVALLREPGGQLRVYPAGEVPQTTKAPYVAYQQISGFPENHLNQLPQVDSFGTQIDIYSETLDDGIEVKIAVRDAIEAVAYITAWLGTSREPETALYRLSFEVDWYTDRNN
jgi:hypothetical protein